MAGKFPKVVSCEVGPTEVKGETRIRRSNRLPDTLIATPFENEPECDTAWKCLERGAKKFGTANFLGWREYKDDGKRGDYIWQNYADGYTDCVNLGIGLKLMCKLDATSAAAGDAQPRLGTYSINRPEVSKSVYASFSQRICLCPLYDTLGASAAGFIIEHANVTTVATERTKFKNLLDTKKGKSPLKFIVMFEEATDDEKKQATSAGCTLFSFSEVMAAGAAKEVSETPPGCKLEDWAYVMYTSGTTGDPKGVILTQENILASAAGLFRGNANDFINQNDVYISYLPMAHSFEVCMQMCCVSAGAAVGFFQGDPKLLVAEDLPALKPTVMAGVPRIYSRVYDKVMQGLEKKGKVAQMLFSVAFANQSWCVANLGIRNPIWDLILFGKVREALGGRVRLLASGAAPLSADLHKFLGVVFGCPVLQGYGMTENAAAAVAQPLGYTGAGNVGGPIPCTEVKLVDTDDYKCTDVYPGTKDEFEAQVSFKGEFKESLAGKSMPRGEVCLRGKNVFQGYYKLEKETKETLDADGWLHTGDIGMWAPDGALQIIDRKKNIFKLAQGEYVAPDTVEGAIGVSKWVMQVFIYGDSEQVCVVAIVVPDAEVLMPWAKANGIEGDLKAVCQNEEVKKMIFEDMTACGKAAKLRSFELPKDIAFETEVNHLGQGFFVENDLLTPTFKLKRPQLQKRYSKVAQAMYAELKKKGIA